MPRQYGLNELQLLVNAATEAGFKLGRARAILDENEIPRAEDLLKELGIEHPMNIDYDPTKARSWHPPGKSAA